MCTIDDDEFAHSDLARFASFEDTNRTDPAVLRGV